MTDDGLVDIELDADLVDTAQGVAAAEGLPVHAVISRWVRLGQQAAGVVAAADDEALRSAQFIDYRTPRAWLEKHFETDPVLLCKECGAVFPSGPDDWLGRHERTCSTADLPIPPPADPQRDEPPPLTDD